MSYSNKYDAGKESQRREEESRNMRSSKNTPSKAAGSRVARLSYDNFGKTSINSPCAFHPSEKITNFCTNKECLLPLCPKCVKIHTDEHIKMGIFGEFDTIEESLRITEDGLRYSFEKLAELETLLVDIKQAYESKVHLQTTQIAEEKRKLREAKNYYIETIQNIFDSYEKALLAIENKQNNDFLEQMYNSDAVLTHLSDHFNKCYKKIGNNQSLMEGIINYFSQAQEIERVEIASQKLQKLFPETINVVYHTQQLERIDSTVKRYLDINKRNDAVWAQYKRITSKTELPAIEKPKQMKKQQRLSPIRSMDNSQTPQRSKQEAQKIPSSSKNMKISQLGNLQTNLNLGKFKSPLDNFSLANNRRSKYDIK